MTTHYLPDANEPALQPFTQTFVGMMFAHAAFEHRVSDLMEVITGDISNALQRAWIDAFKRADKAFADRDALLVALKDMIVALEEVVDDIPNPRYARATIVAARAVMERAEGGVP